MGGAWNEKTIASYSFQVLVWWTKKYKKKARRARRWFFNENGWAEEGEKWSRKEKERKMIDLVFCLFREKSRTKLN